MSNVKLIRLLSGEELIAEIVATVQLLSSAAETNTDIGPLKVKNPIMLVTKEDEANGQVRTQMAPWVAYKDKDAIVTIREGAIVFVAEADDRLIAQYNKIFSKIITPPQGLILPGR